MDDVLLDRFLPHDDVINVAPCEWQVPQDGIHPPLEVGRGVFQPEGDHLLFPQDAVGPPEGRLGSVLLAQRHLVVTAPHVLLKMVAPFMALKISSMLGRG